MSVLSSHAHWQAEGKQTGDGFVSDGRHRTVPCLAGYRAPLGSLRGGELAPPQAETEGDRGTINERAVG